jgi:thiol-disulfide isomerase/thioredoxin
MYRLLAGVLVLGVAVLCARADDKPPAVKEKVDLSVGKKMPALTSQDLDGKKVKLSDLKGKVVVVDVWATWCGPCRAMIPHERELVKRLKGKPFVLVSVSADASKETVKTFLEKNEMPWTHWWDGARGPIYKMLVDRGIPTAYVIDAKGIIRAKIVGFSKDNMANLDKAVDAALKDLADSKSS